MKPKSMLLEQSGVFLHLEEMKVDSGGKQARKWKDETDRQGRKVGTLEEGQASMSVPVIESGTFKNTLRVS